MKIKRIDIENFRSLKNVSTDFNNTNIFIGKNDSGKSNILAALKISLDISKYQKDFKRSDLDTESSKQKIKIRISLIDIPKYMKIGNRKIYLERDSLLSKNNEFVLLSIAEFIDKDFFTTEKFLETYDYKVFVYKKSNSKERLYSFLPLKRNYEYYLEREDALMNLTKKELKQIIDGLKLKPSTKINIHKNTNRYKQEIITQHLRKDNTQKQICNTQLNKIKRYGKILETCIEEILPTFILFKADENLNIKNNSFQEVITEKIINDTKIKNLNEEMKKEINNILSKDFKKILEILKEKTDFVTNIKANSNFDIRESLLFSIITKDIRGVETSLMNRGTGIKRLLMLSVFEYFFEKGKNIIFAIEEPETYLHPEQQRKLLSFLKEKSKRNQIFISTHSPNFIDNSNIESMNLVTKTKEKGTEIKKLGKDNKYKVIYELGFKLSDVLQADSIVFTEGPSDIPIFKTFMEKCNHQPEKFNISFLSLGGNTARHINIDDLIKINKNFVIILDSEKKTKNNPIEPWRIDLKRKIEQKGRKCVILKRRSIENYLSSHAMAKVLNVDEKSLKIGHYDNVKEKINKLGVAYDKIKNGIDIAKEMKPYEIDNEIKLIVKEIIKTVR